MGVTDTQALLQLAQAHQAAGRLPQAEQVYRQILARQPNQPQALHLLGVLAGECGRYDQALELIGRSVAADPTSVDANFNFGIALLRQGSLDRAITAFRAAIKLRPDFAEAYAILGVPLAALGRADEAIAAFRAAIRINPGFAEAYGNLGVALAKFGRVDEAIPALRTAIRLKPGFADAYGNLGSALGHLGRVDEAIAAYRTAVQLRPDYADAYGNLGGALLRQGLHDQAVAACQRAIALNPNLATAHCNLGGALEAMGQLDAASSALHRAITLDPNLATAHCNLGVVLRAQGQLDQAQAAFRTALRLQPSLAQAHAHLATLLRGQLPADDRQALEACLDAGALVGEPRARLLYGFAQVLDATADYARAADCLRQAKALDLEAAPRLGHQYLPREHEELVDGMIEVFNPEFFARTRGAGSASPRPVFVFGLPRSGTTLVEQVLASHPRIHDADELPLTCQTLDAIPGAVGRSGPPLRCVSALDAQAIRRLAQQHLDKLDAIDNARAARIVDKLPDNYVFLGLLATLFPHATFIHCRRDLRDVAVSCWITDFSSLYWTNDPDHLVGRFTQYRRLMAHWHKVLPVPIHEVDYEQVVGDLEGQARRLVTACGLEWDPACLAFHQTRRTVRTASGTQVRQPIYDRSIARWKNYEHELAGLFARLPVG